MKDLKYRVKRLQKRAQHYKESDPSGKELRAFSKDYLAVRHAIEKLSSDLANAYRIYGSSKSSKRFVLFSSRFKLLVAFIEYAQKTSASIPAVKKYRIFTI